MNHVEQTKIYICTICPRGCEIAAQTDSTGDLSITGATCAKGEDYVLKEMLDPRRVLTTSVLLLNGESPLVSVRTRSAIPRRLLMEAVQTLSTIQLKAPVMSGQVVATDLLGTGVEVIATKTIQSKKGSFNN